MRSIEASPHGAVSTSEVALTVLLGGARSGKSTLATSIAVAAGSPVCYIATAEARDEEMTARIEVHRRERPAGWSTVEEPLDLLAALTQVPDGSVVIVDCLTLWVANLIEQGFSDDEVVRTADKAASVAARRSGSAIAISNEVGSGLVPMDPLGRRYRDLLGIVNSRWCAQADSAFLVVAGRVLALSDPSALTGAG